MQAAHFFHRHRIAAAALLASAALHAAILVGVPPRLDRFDASAGFEYSASLHAAAATNSAPPPATPAPAHKRAAKPRLPPRAAEPLLEPMSAPELLADSSLVQPRVEPVALPSATPGIVAAPVPALDSPPFPVEALPASLSISYSLTSSFAEGRADYHWSREGDHYTINGEAEAIGFFALFLEGSILQESRGVVTPEGLRPERFTERMPNTAPEGLEFDWPARKVTLDYKNEKTTEELTDNSLDWLSMIFQMAHLPPRGEAYVLRVFTQRKRYQFNLVALGVEEIEIPLGAVRALHLRHTDPQDREVVDVWLGIDQHYLPVKLRYPVARNRLTVEQSATRVTAR
jgi:hypothetical protein